MMLAHKRYDTRVTRLAGGVRVEVYWRADELGCGPCMSVYVGKKERLRFDLFDPAHMHMSYIAGAPRHYYEPGLARAHYIELAAFDLARHCPKAARAAGWAAEMLGKVSGPAEPVIEVRPIRRLGHGLRAR